MKLYATTTSERASKGQGGNEFLHIDLTSGDTKTFLGRIKLVYKKLDGLLNEYDEVEIQYHSPYVAQGYKVIEDIKIPHTKGKKQKTAKEDICEHCKSAVSNEYKGCYCPQCGELIASRI